MMWMTPKKPQVKRQVLWVLVATAALSIIAWLAWRPSLEKPAGQIPGPAGGPSIAQDVNTLAGRPAPSFSLPDAESNMHTIQPGRGREIVIISHMGFY